MKLYADHPARRARQLVGDLGVVAWVVAWVLVGRAVHAAISRLAAPGRTLEDAGASLEAGLGDAAGGVADVPLVGERLRSPLDAAGGAAGTITRAGQGLQDGVAQLADVVALTVAAWPVLAVLAVWLVVRVRFARRAGVASALVAAGTAEELFALRALARAPLPVLLRVTDDPAGAWRRRDPDVVPALAALELRRVGVDARPARTV
ncbi:hypothetical protein GXB85_01075 [Cellulomonas sp. APG4]|uniref:hypothetical protein n=1 Tax=Cellulomonas sp. APG4 TaxID=1538656 RepID=UPI00137B7FCE|nr:hypothetical protein [Cellulomonas sp. APG4]NCT89549.1 hypothetical protein [Cellulomonas sp. APG4]